MSNQKRLLSEPPISELLSGLVRCGKHYYRVNPETGFHTPVAARAELLKLMSQVTVTRILREAVSAGLITEGKIDLVAKPSDKIVGRSDHQEEAAVAARGDDIEDDPDESEPEKKEHSPYHERQQQTRQRFQLVKSVSRHGVYFGVYDADHQTEELISIDRQEALQEIARRIAAEDMDHVPYYLKFRTGLAA
jgi:hypothetical protein